jgi:hypothetical protein
LHFGPFTLSSIISTAYQKKKKTFVQKILLSKTLKRVVIERPDRNFQKYMYIFSLTRAAADDARKVKVIAFSAHAQQQQPGKNKTLDTFSPSAGAAS